MDENITVDELYKKENEWIELLIGPGETLRVVFTNDKGEKEILSYVGVKEKQLRFKAEYREYNIV